MKITKEILEPMKEFTPIAMRCTQEQFDDIKPKLKGLKGLELISSFSDCSYLVNNLRGEEKLICNVMDFTKASFNRIVHEEWNEEIFLKSAGIEIEIPAKQFSLEELKKAIEMDQRRERDQKKSFNHYLLKY